MANLKDIRNRIESVESTQQITTAMRMVSASKLRKAQLAFSAIQPYADNLLAVAREAYATLSSEIENADTHTENTSEKPIETVLLVVLSSNRGLCGSFNSNITKYVGELLKTKYKENLKAGKLHLITAGHRSGDVLAKQNLPIASSHNDLMDKVDYKKISVFSSQLLNMFQNNIYDRIVLIYNKYRTVLTQEVTEQQLLPIVPSSVSENVQRHEPTEYIFEPGKEIVLKSLYPKILSIQLYRTFLESVASEQGARMTAMQQASDNASALLKELKITYNKERQAAITNELLEIISGSEALNNQ